VLLARRAAPARPAALTTEQLNAVWGSSTSELWAVGSGGVILRRAGTWSPVSSGTTATLHGVWGSAASDAWAVGDQATILHWNGSAWSKENAGISGIALHGIWGSSTTDLWVVGQSGAILRHK
jgi:hypothetical protein